MTGLHDPVSYTAFSRIQNNGNNAKRKWKSVWEPASMFRVAELLLKLAAISNTNRNRLELAPAENLDRHLCVKLGQADVSH